MSHFASQPAWLNSMLRLAFSALALALALHCCHAFPHTHPIGRPHEWTELGAAPGTATAVLEVAIKQDNIPQLYTILQQISDPGSLYYGQWLSLPELRSVIGPSPTRVSAVQSYFQSVLDPYTTDISFDYSLNQEFVLVRAPVAAVNQAFGVTYQVYQHSNGERRFRTKERVLPANFGPIADDIGIVIGINDFISQPTGENPPPDQTTPAASTAPIFGEALATEEAFVVLGNTLFCKDKSLADATVCLSTGNPIISVNVTSAACTRHRSVAVRY